MEPPALTASSYGGRIFARLPENLTYSQVRFDGVPSADHLLAALGFNPHEIDVFVFKTPEDAEHDDISADDSKHGTWVRYGYVNLWDYSVDKSTLHLRIASRRGLRDARAKLWYDRIHAPLVAKAEAALTRTLSPADFPSGPIFVRKPGARAFERVLFKGIPMADELLAFVGLDPLAWNVFVYSRPEFAKMEDLPTEDSECGIWVCHSSVCLWEYAQDKTALYVRFASLHAVRYEAEEAALASAPPSVMVEGALLPLSMSRASTPAGVLLSHSGSVEHAERGKGSSMQSSTWIAQAERLAAWASRLICPRKDE